MAIAGYDKDLLLTIDNTKIDGTLTNFPVLVKLDDTIIDFTDCQSAGQDIRFGALTTDTYDYEIESWDATAEEATVWVKIPSVSSSADTTFYMHYSNSGASDGQNASGVWDNGYILVCHMKNLGMVDSSGNNVDGSTTNMAAANIVDGKVYKGLEFNGTDEWTEFPDATVLDVTTAVTVEVSLNVGSFQSASPYIRGIITKDLFGADGFTLRFGDSRLAKEKIQWVVQGNKVDGTFTYSTGTDYNIAATHGGGKQIIYKNGVLEVSENDSDTMEASGETLLIGRTFTVAGNRYWDGMLDEVRLSNVVRVAAWLLASSYSTNDNLLTYGGSAEVDTNFLMFF